MTLFNTPLSLIYTNVYVTYSLITQNKANHDTATQPESSKVSETPKS